jgi:hypothetical protein
MSVCLCVCLCVSLVRSLFVYLSGLHAVVGLGTVLALTRREDNLSIWLTFATPADRAACEKMVRKAKARSDLETALARTEQQEAILVRGASYHAGRVAVS